MEGSFKPAHVLIAVVLISAMLCGTIVGTVVLLNKPTVTIAAPASPSNDSLRTIETIAKGNPAKALVAGKAFQDFAWVLARPETNLSTTEDLRSAIVQFETSLWKGTEMSGSLPGMSQAINDYLALRLGKEVAPFAGKRDAAVTAIKDIARSLGAKEGV